MSEVTPFTFLTSINSTKRDEFQELNGDANYVPFLINRQLSYFPDCILLANLMNQYSGLSKRQQYAFYLSAVRKQRRFSKWGKRQQDDLIPFVRKTYDMSAQAARSMIELLSPSELQQLREYAETMEKR